MTARSSKHDAPSPLRTLSTASAAALGALAGSPVALGQAGEAFSLEKTPELITPDSGQDQALPVEGQVKVDEHLIVDLHVVDEDLADVLQMLSIQSQRNIVASKNVSATVTATLYGVTFYEALDAILHVNGFGYVEEGNFIYVYTAEEIQRLIESSRQRTTAVIPLDYINSSDAAEFAQALLSENGQIKAPGKTQPFQIPDSAPVGADDLATESFIVVVDYEENVEAIRNLLAQIDTKPSQVLVEATILQAALTENNAFGVDFSIIGNMNFGDFLGGPLNAVDNLISGQGEDINGSPTALPGSDNGRASAGASTVGRTSGPASLKIGYVDGDFAAFLRVLDEVTDTTIIARPKVLTLNRQPARVLVGERVGYLSSTTTQTGTTQTVDFLDTGTQLYFRPFVSRDGLIRMELKPQVSEAVIRDATDSGGASVTIPDETTNELTANVMVRDGQTIVLGGLFRERTQYTRRQVPWIADLPIVGHAFKGRDDATDRAEIIFMITPTIVNDQIVSEHAERAKALIDSAVAGTREGLLPFSRDKQASRLLVEAQQHAAAGRTKKALYCVRRSLSLNPNQPQAQLLLERLTPKTRSWPAQSVLQTTFNTEMDLYLDEFGNLEPAEPAGAEGSVQAPQADDAGPDTVAAADEGAVAEQEPVVAQVEGEQPANPDALAQDEAQVALQAEAQVQAEASESVVAAADPDADSTDQADPVEPAELAESVEPADPALAQAEAQAAQAEAFDESELVQARVGSQEPAQDEPASSESAFASSAWIASLAQAEVGQASQDQPAQTDPQPGEPTTDADDAADPAPAVAFDEASRTFDVSVQEAALPGLLRELAAKSRRSIIVSPEVSGTVSASLFGLSLEETLEAILPEQGLGYVVQGKVIRVLPASAIAAQPQPQPQTQTQTQTQPVVAQTPDQAEEQAQPALAANEPANEPAEKPADEPVAEAPSVVVAQGPDAVAGAFEDAGQPVADAPSPASVVDAPLSLEQDAGSDGQQTADAFQADAADDPIEAQIAQTLSEALRSAVPAPAYRWTPRVPRDAVNEPVSWRPVEADAPASDAGPAPVAPQQPSEATEPTADAASDAAPAAAGSAQAGEQAGDTGDGSVPQAGPSTGSDQPQVDR
ncbi:MAG: hypothetical protein KatS3mg103_0305 [Phycisphaerales bacterium]|nr:MAG: hypothetical protein KatS3mg103_0305 [Phycisphaerales bacterium]